MRKLMLPLAVLSILAFAAEAFAQCDGKKCRRPVRKAIQVLPVQEAIGGVAKIVGKVAQARPARRAASIVSKVVQAKPARAVVRGARCRVRQVAKRVKYRVARRPLLRRCR